MFRVFLLFLMFTASAHAAPSEKTIHWEKKVFAQLHTVLCGSHGKYTKAFKLSKNTCSKTYKYAQNHCSISLRKLPFYRVTNSKTSKLWGKYVGLCIGVAFNMKHIHP